MAPRASRAMCPIPASKGLTVAVGNTGGDAGAAGTVLVQNVGPIITQGDGAKGILAQSIGGGGGSGGIGINGKVTGTSNDDSNTNQLFVGIGGSSGAGGVGNTVTVTNSGDISTGTAADGSVLATQMDAIFAQSIGGGGGMAGAGISGDFTAASGAKALEFGLGGSGGTGANGAAVTVSNAGDLTARGDTSRGIFAQSIGGGGGNGGAGILGNVSTGKDGSRTTQLEVGIALNAGSAGDGGAVSVTNSGAITTQAIQSQTAGQMHAIFAQSVGGGGGSGSVGIGGNLTNASNSKSLAVGVGGGSGAGGSGSTVAVTNLGILSVTGNQSVGIFAQSVGGGGGTGGAGVAGNASLASDASGVTQLSVGVGGAGGTAGTGSDVQVINNGGITSTQNASSDAQMYGIFAQSVGGGGGSGGIGIGGNVTSGTDSKSLDVGIGGTGKGGGTGGTVSVSNTADIATAGDASMGIFAQSIGGGGGAGGAGFSGTVSGGGSEDSSNSKAGKTLSFALGASGGGGGAGGDVNVENSGLIVTGNGSGAAMSQAHGIFAQSVGGGGGVGVLTGSLDYGGTASGKGIAMTVGSTPTGGDGGTVTVVNTGLIQTQTPASYGVFAQSVGGSGGAVGDLGGMGAQDSWTAVVTLGSTGGAGNGGAVTIANGGGQALGSGSITTTGDGSFALYAQSIGGGGGDGGNAAGLINSSDASATTENAKVTLNSGAHTASTGDGGAVTITHLGGDLVTTGTSAPAVYAQSIGGGGGTVGTGAVAASGSVNLGGTGGTEGDGGTVTVTIAGGSITTGNGARAAGGVISSFGILAQSVGGGGGVAGNINFADAQFGTNLAMNSGGNATTGNGGNVTVTVAAPITTAGASSLGVFAQSVGGAGGIKGDVQAQTAGALIGSGGGVGDGGDVTVNVSADITTSGANAYGVFAQSASGASGTNATGAPGTVNVNVTNGATVSATGAGAKAIYTQAIGTTTSSTSDLTVTVNTGATVIGSTAIHIDSGWSHQQFVDNAGTIIGRPMAIQGTMDTVSNAGTIHGNVEIGGLTAPFANLASGVFEIGSSASLQAAQPSADAELNNAGILSPGGVYSVVTTTLFNPVSGVHANLVQTATGILAIDVIATQRTGVAAQTDRIQLDGTADLAGKVRVVFRVGDAPAVGPQTAGPIVTAQNGVTDATRTNLTVVPSVAGNYSLDPPDTTDIFLNYNIDFTASGAGLDTSHHRLPIMRHLQDAFVAGVLDPGLADSLIAISDPATYLRDDQLAASGDCDRYADQHPALRTAFRRCAAELRRAERHLSVLR